MKNLIYLLLLLPLVTHSQNPSLRRTHDKLSVGDKEAWLIIFDDASEKVVKKEWIDFLKDRNAKVKTSGDFVNGHGIELVQAGSDSMNVYSFLRKSDEKVLLSVAFAERDRLFYPEQSDVTRISVMEEMLAGFALKTKKFLVSEEIVAAEKVLSKMNQNMEDLARRNNGLAKSNEKMKEDIKDNEKEIEENKKKHEELDKQRNGQNITIRLLNEKLQSVK